MTHAGMYYHTRAGEPLSRLIPPGELYVELMVGGRGWVRHEGQLVEVRAGDLLWHMPGDETICRNDPKDPYICFHVRFELRQRRPTRVVPHLARWADMEAVRQFTQQVLRWYTDERTDREGLLHFTYGMLLIHAQQQVWRTVRDPLPDKTLQVLLLLEENYASSRSLESLAAEVGWSLSHMHAVFKRHIGTTPHEIVQITRLRAAKEMLAGSDRQIKEIADACGYNSAAAFCHAFRQRTGQTPREWRLAQFGLGG